MVNSWKFIFIVELHIWNSVFWLKLGDFPLSHCCCTENGLGVIRSFHRCCFHLCSGCVAWLLLSSGSAKGCHTEAEGKFLRMVWLSEMHSLVQRCCCHSDFHHWHNSWDGKTFLGQQDWETWCHGSTNACYPRLAEEGVSVHLPIHGWSNACLLLSFGLWCSEGFIKTSFNFIFVRVLGQWTPSQAKFCDTSTDKRSMFFSVSMC